jgi:Mg-chelatase subunit ChlD
MADWIRRSFSAPGLTQIPPGRHLGKLQGRFGGGTVMLCIDVSGSMDGKPLREAVRGAKTFVTEAVEARYKVGVLLWDTGVVDLAEPSADGKAAMKLLNRTKEVAGGTSLLAALERCYQILDLVKDAPDRVVAIFGDGDLGPRDRVLAKVAQMKAEDIRFVTRGLGGRAASEFAEVSSEDDTSDVVVHDVDQLAEGIATMVASLKSRAARSR